MIYVGSRDYERAFFDKRKQFLSSKADLVEVCLDLLPATNYSILITALSAGFTATITINTSLTGIADRVEAPNFFILSSQGLAS